MSKLILIASILMLITMTTAGADVTLISSPDGPGLKISSMVSIVPGSIFYETAGGRTFLTADPDKASSNEWQWKQQDSRVIKIKAEPTKIGYKITLNSTPNKDVVKWGFSVGARPHEYFTGIMERIVDGNQDESWRKGMTEAMDMHGQKVEMVVKPTTAVYDSFYLSNNGYGLAVNTTWPGKYDFAKEDPQKVQIEFEGSSLPVRFYLSWNPAEIIKAHAMESGPPILPPKWAFTPWRWRDEHQNKTTYYDGTTVNAPYNSQVVEDILMMEAYGIPCGVYWLDRPWGPGRNGYDEIAWDDNRFPNHKRMIDWLGSKDTKLLLWIAPWTEGEISSMAREKGYDVPGQKSTGKERCLIDFTNPEGKKFWQGYIGALLKEGVAGFKLDRSEESIPAELDKFVYDGRPTRETRNDYPVQYVRATWEIAKKVRGNDFVLLPRAAFTGSTKYGVFWGGDVRTDEWGLRASIVAVQKSAVLGYPFWGSDTCGYSSTIAEPETCARWLAFSAFNPIMEVGPTDDKAFWDMTRGPAYNPELIAAWRLYAIVHNNLVDYSYKYAQEAHETGMPVVRPLFVSFPEQRESWKDWQTFLYGEDILVSAVWDKGVTTHKLYLPGGVKWVDAWDTGKVYDGGKYIEVDTPAYKMPIFIRQGSKVKLGDLEGLYKESLTIAQKKPNLAELQKTVK